MTRRLRVAHVVLQPVLVWDDGEELTDGPAVEPLRIAASQLTAYAARLPAEIDNLASQLESGDPTGPMP